MDTVCVSLNPKMMPNNRRRPTIPKKPKMPFQEVKRSKALPINGEMMGKIPLIAMSKAMNFVNCLPSNKSLATARVMTCPAELANP